MRILIADDHALFRDSLRSLLEAHDIEVVGEARNGREAVEKAMTEKPDLIILDVMMPEMHGYDACEEIKSGDSTSSIPVILLTGVAEHLRETTFSHQQGMETQADEYIPKPVDPDALVDAVNRLLAC